MSDSSSQRHAYVEGIRRGDRTTLARAITLVESTRADDQALAQEILHEILPENEDTYRIGVTGIPGAGKSTFLDALGCVLVNEGHRVAMLTVDPSSSTGGSILGDKVRMTRLSQVPEVFIRPSPSTGSLGGVTPRTREAMLLCEAAGYDVVVIETVGVGQSESRIADIVDFFLLLTVPGTGDELQTIKRGILEYVDLVAINKADGDALESAQDARRQIVSVLNLIKPRYSAWSRDCMTMSALTGQNISDVWRAVLSHRQKLSTSGERLTLRQQQRLNWLWHIVDEEIRDRLHNDPRIRAKILSQERAVKLGEATPLEVAREIVEKIFSD